VPYPTQGRQIILLKSSPQFRHFGSAPRDEAGSKNLHSLFELGHRNLTLACGIGNLLGD
jgi:hypothetical protein